MKKPLLSAVVLFAILTTWTLAQNSTPTGWVGAQWIWDEASANTVTQNDEPRFLRLAFTLEAKPTAADLWITADNVYVAYVNGQKVGEDTEWATVEQYDVAKHLVVGKNVLAINATNQGGVAGVIARLHVKTNDKKDHFIVTNDKTKIFRAGSVSDGQVSKEWIKTDFNDSAWFNAITLGDTGIGPWNLTAGGAKAGKGKGKGGAPPAQFNYNTTEVVPVKGRLTPQEQIKHFVVPKDFEIELVAADPLIINPITMVVDDKGRIIVSESHTYRFGPPGSPIKPYANPVIRLDPDGKGGFTRTLIADGFADPVMGIAVKGDKLWLAANNYLYTYDIPAKPAGERSEPAGSKATPLAINKKTIVTDLTKAWNPFGMFVLEWGPDGKLYLSVGNHAINLQSPDGKMSGKGSSGIVVRMNPDGTKMERLVQGLRVPYSFEYDPFGQMWLLSNGEGNPNRFVRVIEGVDYHCYSRGAVDNAWLAGNHPLAPPCEELHRGANTQLMRYYGADFPQEYQGNLFLCNWGAHGFAGNNRAIIRFVPDERNNISKREPLVWCKDPHFRPAHIHLDVDGSLLIADWYGRDDESDMTGRIWRLKYVGKDRPVVKHKLDAAEWKNDDYAIEALGSPDHMIRAKAVAHLVKNTGPQIHKSLQEHAANAKEALGAANALWVMLQVWDRQLPLNDYSGVAHADWKVQRLALNIVRNNLDRAKNNNGIGVALPVNEAVPAVWLEFHLTLAYTNKNADVRRSELSQIFARTDMKVANDPHLRYEAAWHLAKYADEKAITKLLTSADADVRLAGLIAIDVACYENFPTKKAALEALTKALENPGKLDHQLLLKVAELNGDASIVPGLEKLIARDDLPTATIAKAVLVLKAKSGGSLASSKLSAAAGKRFIEAVEKGSLKIASPSDQLVIFEFLESEGPTPFALKQIAGQLQSANKDLRQAAHVLARRFGPKASSLAEPLWPSVLNPKTKFEDTVDYLSTIARTDGSRKADAWEKLLEHDDIFVRSDAIRWWRTFGDRPDMIEMLRYHAPKLIKKDDRHKEDLAAVFRDLKQSADKTWMLPEAEKDKESLTKYAVKELGDIPAAERPKRAAMGLQVFERNACTKCHTTATATTPLAPSLKGVAGQKLDYLIESVLYPSKIIKTGWEVELIELKNGKVITGLVKDDGKTLRVIQANDYLKGDLRIDKADVDTRRTSKISLMPEGQEATMSRRELVDLIAYLQTLK
ncbi:MAG: hypothetical protein EXS16_12765 [Gemmataceae bacterium]|nr:hypothetical protein [Gemmataceae bacterium]